MEEVYFISTTISSFHFTRGDEKNSIKNYLYIVEPIVDDISED